MSSESTPMVSVFMPTYNQEHLIVESIESVINQSYGDWELVIGDDCSTDRTFEIALEYQKKYPNKIKLFKNEKNLGVTGNCNEVLRRCIGKYIAFTAGDDLFLPEKLEKQVALMESNPDCIFSYHDVEVFDSDSGKTIKFWNHGVDSNKAIVGSTSDVTRALVSKCASFLAALSVMTRRSAMPVTGYDCRIPVASEVFMWIETCANNNGSVLFCDDVLARYRKHSQGVSFYSNKYRIDLYVTLALVEDKYRFLINDTRKARGYFRYKEGVDEIINANYVEGRKLLLEGVRYSIFSIKLFGWILYSYYKQLLNIFR